MDSPLDLRTLKRNSEPLKASSPLIPCVDILVSAFFLFQRRQKSRLASLVLAMSWPLFNAVGVGKMFFWACGVGTGADAAWSERELWPWAAGSAALPLQQYWECIFDSLHSGSDRAQVQASLCFMVTRLYLRANFYISLHVLGNSDFQGFQ